MKTLNKFIFLGSFLMTINIALFARQIAQDSIQFSVKIKNFTNKNYNRLLGTFNSDDGFQYGKVGHFQKDIPENGVLNFKLPNLHKPYRIKLFSNLHNQIPLIRKYYYVESGDSIHMEMVSDGEKGIKGLIHFSGTGSEKYNLIEQLENQFWNEYYRDLSSAGLGKRDIKDSADLESKMEKLASILKVYQKKKKQLIDNANISSKMKAIINYDYSRYMSEWVLNAKYLYDNNITFRKQIAIKYFRYNDIFFEKPDSLSIYCQYYLLGLREKIALEKKISENSNLVDIISFYNHIKSNYNGVFRDKLIGDCLLTPGAQSNFRSFEPYILDSLLKDAYSVVATQYVKNGINNGILKIRKKNNVKVIDAQFTGLDGKPFYLNALKGKVFLIDVWFNGCAGCAGFHSAFKKEIYPKFKENKNFVVLSINTDKDKERWLSGIKSRSYTSEDYINVTTGSWFDHPFFNYYSVKGAPYLMLIDANGTIRYQPAGTSIEVMIEQITMAFQNKISL